MTGQLFNADAFAHVRGQLSAEQISDLRGRVAWDRVACQWFARCGRQAVDVAAHPILGGVPVCERCKAFIRSHE